MQNLVEQFLSKSRVTADNELSIETSQGTLSTKFDHPVSMDDVEDAVQYFHRITLQNILNGIRHSFDELVRRIEDNKLTMMDTQVYRELVYNRINRYIEHHVKSTIDRKDTLIPFELVYVLRVTNFVTSKHDYRLAFIKLKENYESFAPTHIILAQGWENRNDDFIPATLVKANPLGF